MTPEETTPATVEHRKPAEVRDYDDKVWDMVLNLVHPVFLYVVMQILIWTHLGGHPGLSGFGLPVFGLQFLGAWALFYSTLLRDMGMRSLAAPILAGLALIGCVTQYFAFPDPLAASASAVRAFLAAQLLPAPLVWAVTFRRWRRIKRLYLATMGPDA